MLLLIQFSLSPFSSPPPKHSGVSSFNQFIHELSVDSDTSSPDYSSGEEDSNGYESPATPLSQSSRASRASFASASQSSRASRGSFKYGRRQMTWIQYIMLWVLFPIKFLLGIPVRLFRIAYSRVSKVPPVPASPRPSYLHSKRVQSIKDHVIHRATDRRRGVIEVLQPLAIYISLYFFF